MMTSEELTSIIDTYLEKEAGRADVDIQTVMLMQIARAVTLLAEQGTSDAQS